MRPARIDQVIPSIVGRDAIGHHTLECQRVLRSLGFVSEIYAAAMGPEMSGRVHLLSELPRQPAERQWICYQASTGSEAAEVFAEHPGTKLLDYHNITPETQVERWKPSLAEELSLGRRQLAELAPQVCLALADSAYNRAELEEWGYEHSVVSMLMVDRANFDVPADEALAGRLAEQKERGGADWLLVGQLLPHKCQHDVVAAFAAYKKAYDPEARLHLVGRPTSTSYAAAVRGLGEELGLGDSLDMAGSVSPAELAALYRASDAYVSCSEHEGFCAPLIEAMHHGLPVVAYGAGAVPETLGGAGLVLVSKEPAVVAAAVHRLLSDSGLRTEMARSGQARAGDFSPERARGEFARAIELALTL